MSEYLTCKQCGRPNIEPQEVRFQYGDGRCLCVYCTQPEQPERPQSLRCRMCHFEVTLDDVGVGREYMICKPCLDREAGTVPQLSKTLLRDVREAAGRE